MKRDVMDTEQPTILVIDRDEATCVLLREILEADGYSVAWCSSFALVESAMAHTRPDLVMLGVSSLSETELDTLATVRRLGPGAPLVLTSTSLEIREWAERTQASGYLGKPFDVAVPAQVVANALRGRHAGN